MAVKYSRFTFDSPVGDICGIRLTLSHRGMVLFVSVYIRNNQTILKMKQFFLEALHLYQTGCNAPSEINFSEVPIFMAGDFNLDFSKDSSHEFVNFLKENFNLKPCSDLTKPITKSRTCIDAVFTRNLPGVSCNTYVCYFSHHRPIVSLLGKL